MNYGLKHDVVTIGVICGDDVAEKIVWDIGVPTNSHGNSDTLRMLKFLEPGVRLQRMHVSSGYLRQPRRWRFDECDLIWNQISDGTQNPKTLAIADKIMSRLRQPIVNPPAKIMATGRADISKRLQGIDGVITPKVLTLRNPTLERVTRAVDGADFKFPAILRLTGTHNGEVVGIFPDVASMEQIFGDRKSEYFLIEYVDVRPADGLYRKTRFFFLGDRTITRQHIIADDWSVHGVSSRRVMADRPDLQDESRDRLVNGFASLPAATRAAIDTIRDRIGLDYFGLDCCIGDSGELVVFECNATMNFNPHFRHAATQHNRAALPRYLDAMRQLILAKTGKDVGPGVRPSLIYG